MKSRVAIAVSAIIEKLELFGGGFWIFVIVFGMLTDPPDDMAVTIIILIIGLICLGAFIGGLKRMKMRKDFKKIVRYLSVEPTGRLEGISTATGMPVDKVKVSIASMIYKGFFVNAYINENTNCLVVGGNDKVVLDENLSENYIPRQCKNCGGISKIIVGRPGSCDFCGSILN